MSATGTLATWFNRLFARGSATREAGTTLATSADSRATAYDVNDALYDNTIYQGWLNQVLSCYFGRVRPDTRIVGFFNPIKQIVDAYQNVLPGVFGNGIAIDPMADGRPVNESLADPIRQIWRDSNLDTTKNTLQKYAANLGTVGIRSIRTETAVRVELDHPSRLFHVEEDGRGNVTEVVLKYTVKVNRGTPIEPQYDDQEVVEIINETEFSQTRDGKQKLTDEQRRNTFGFCPYVLLRHKDNGTTFGDWAYKGSEAVVHAINYRLTQQDVSIGRHMFPRWFFASAGEKPTEIDMGAEKATWARMLPDSPNPIVEAIVPKVDQKAAMDFVIDKVQMLRRRQPEMAIGDLQLFANISGETLAQVLKQAESAILAVRPAYDHALIRAIQMCLSMGVEVGLFDIGTGKGVSAGERAYREGFELFQFAPRPAIPQTPDQQVKQANAAVADKAARYTVAKQALAIGADSETAFEDAGFDAKKIATIKQRKATNDSLIPTSTL